MKPRTATLNLLLAFTALCVSAVNGINVYLHPQPSTPVPAHLDAQHASLAVARHLGLESFERLGDGDGVWDGAFVWGNEGEGVVGSAKRDGLVLTLSEEDAKKVLPSTLKPTFSLYTPLLDTLHPLIQTYLHRAAHLYTSIFSSASTPSSLSTPNYLLDIFSAPTAANKAFLTSLSALVDFLDAYASTGSGEEHGFENFGAFELKGLQELADQYGVYSEAYQTALKAVQAAIQSALSRTDLSLALLTFPSPSTSNVKRADDEAATPQSPLPPSLTKAAEPISAISTCFTTEEACTNSTSSCSGHGQCVSASKAGKTCYVCACSASRDEKGRSENWAGIACERKDVSGPFVLLGGTIIALTILVAGSIALLTGIGSVELPSVLTGGAAGAAKRD